MARPLTAVRKPRWYDGGLQFECRRCGQCCRGEPGYVWLTHADVDRIAAYRQVQPRALMALSVRRIGRRLSLCERPNGDCVFYADGCAVYPVRPRQCRTFPFWPENLASRRSWGRLRQECPGVGRGRTWTRGEIDLLAGRFGERPRRPEADLARAFSGLLRLYRQVDEALASCAGTCSACGRCCHFDVQEHVLYVTELERALLASRCGSGDPATPPGRCPYQAGAVCAARDVRPLSCRTYFCNPEAAARGRECCEEFLRRMTPLREQAGLEISYSPLPPAESDREKTHYFCLDTFPPGGLNP